jgi:hypothetical protein
VGNPVWRDDDETLTGHVVLTSAGRAFLDIASSRQNNSSAAERVIWTNDEVHQIHPATKHHIIWPIAAEDRGRLPFVLAVPFCWHLNAEKLKTRYHVEVLSSKHAETAEQAKTWMFCFTPSTQIGRDDFSKAYIELNRSTYLPRRYHLVSSDGKSTKDYHVTEARYNQPIPDEVWQIPDLRGEWKVTRMDGVMWWISRGLVKPGLVP